MTQSVEGKSDLEARLVEAGDKLVVLYFFASWCGRCKVMGPTLDEIVNGGQDRVIVISVDIGKLEQLVEMYKIEGTPSFVFIRRGRELDTLRAGTETKLKELLDKYV